MRVALLHSVRMPVRGYGGTERVVIWLARGLAEAGHEVVVLAPSGTRIPEATVVPLDPRQSRTRGFDLRRHLPKEVDIVHAHFPLEPLPGVPLVWTLHGLGGSDAPLAPNAIAVSRDHAARHGLTAYVYNGLDPTEYTFSATKGGYDLFLGRLDAVKGWRWAVEGAHRTGRELVVAGGWRPTLRPGLRFVGEVSGDRKAELLAGARCLWMPAQWDEPFGLTLIESLASGTPVLGTRRGALPEIITPEVGALGDTVDELVSRRPEIEQIDPAACRDRVERLFSHRAMTEGYLRMYRGFLADGILPTVDTITPPVPH